MHKSEWTAIVRSWPCSSSRAACCLPIISQLVVEPYVYSVFGVARPGHRRPTNLWIATIAVGAHRHRAVRAGSGASKAQEGRGVPRRRERRQRGARLPQLAVEASQAATVAQHGTWTASSARSASTPVGTVACAIRHHRRVRFLGHHAAGPVLGKGCDRETSLRFRHSSAPSPSPSSAPVLGCLPGRPRPQDHGAHAGPRGPAAAAAVLRCAQAHREG